MSDRDWLDDYMDYKLSSSEESKKPAGNSGCLPCVLCVLALLWIVSKLFDEEDEYVRSNFR